MPRIGFRGRSEFLDSLQKRNGGVNPSYKSRGALAHPVERFHGMEEVSSSSLLCSTSLTFYLKCATMKGWGSLILTEASIFYDKSKSCLSYILSIAS